MRKIASISVLLIPLLALTSGVAFSYLPDLAGHWSASLVSALEARGIIHGDGGGRFLPDEFLTRAQMAKMLVAGLGYDADAQLLRTHASRYTDVPSSHWARGYIEVCSDLGIVEGFPDGRFAPDEPITRAQAVVIAVRAAGLWTRARLSQAERTPYADDAEIPSWARGAVVVAAKEGLVVGMPDGSFSPNSAVTRAEGAALLHRLIQRRGALFHLAGTLVRYEPEKRSGTVRDALGQERSFVMRRDALYMRQGAIVARDQVRPLDQVFIVLDDDGRGTFLEARYQDLVAREATVQEGSLAYTLPSGQRESRAVQPGALIFFNGRQVPLKDLTGADEAYLLLDQTTGEIRLIDAVRAPILGVFAEVVEPSGEVIVLVDQQEERYLPAPDVVVIVDGVKADLAALELGDEVRLALDDAGRLVYIEAMR